MYFNYVLSILFTPISQPVYATMIRLCVYDCFVNFYTSYVLYCVLYITRLRFVSWLRSDIIADIRAAVTASHYNNRPQWLCLRSTSIILSTTSNSLTNVISDWLKVDHVCTCNCRRFVTMSFFLAAGAYSWSFCVFLVYSHCEYLFVSAKVMLTPLNEYL